MKKDKAQKIDKKQNVKKTSRRKFLKNTAVVGAAGTITEEGLRTNIDVGIQYMAEWLLGSGCVPIYNLMEGAVTAEIPRTQIWQWVHHPKGILDDGRKVTLELFRSLMQEEMQKICKLVGDECYGEGKYNLAAQLFD